MHGARVWFRRSPNGRTPGDRHQKSGGSGAVKGRVCGAGIAGRRIKRRLVLAAGRLGGDHRVVALEDQALGAVLAEALPILAADDRERVHDVVDVVAFDRIQPEDHPSSSARISPRRPRSQRNGRPS